MIRCQSTASHDTVVSKGNRLFGVKAASRSVVLFEMMVGFDDLKTILVLPQPALVPSFSASFFEENPGFILDSKLIEDVFKALPMKNFANVFRTIDTSSFVLVREFMRNPYRGDTAQGEVLCEKAMHCGFRDIKPLR